MTLREELAEAEKRVQALKNAIAAGDCRVNGHVWAFAGGKNAGCGRDCSCSAPVYSCKVCGDSDYGDNDKAAQVRADCAAFLKANSLFDGWLDLSYKA